MQSIVSNLWNYEKKYVDWFSGFENFMNDKIIDFRFPKFLKISAHFWMNKYGLMLISIKT